MAIQIGLMSQISTIRENGFGEIRSESDGLDRIENSFPGNKMDGNNGSRMPPGFGDNKDVPIEKPEISLPNMSTNGKMLGPNRTMPRRKSEAATHMGDDSISHHYKGGENQEDKLKAGPQRRNLRKSISDVEEKWAN